MKLARWELLNKLFELLAPSPPAPAQQVLRLKAVERDVMLPVKLAFVGVLVYYLYFSQWLTMVSRTRDVALEMIQRFFFIYVVYNLLMAGLLLNLRRVPLALVQWSLFTGGLLDGLLMAGLTLLTGGFDSILFWVFPALIVRNALTLPLAPQQLTLNLAVSFCYLFAGLLDVKVENLEIAAMDEATRRAREALGLVPPDNAAEPFLLRLMVLLSVTICCYGLQALFERNRRVEEESREFAVRQEQLRAAGRIAAEVAHQLKNPLGIINTAAFNLQRALPQAKDSVHQQIQIIREEVERSDQILTELMGYAQLAEGKVERLEVLAELERALQQVFPPAVQYAVDIQRDYEPDVPALLMQRGHLAGIFVNLLLNAREAMEGGGQLKLSVRKDGDHAVVVAIRDNGPGIAAEHLEKIFEPHYTTKPRGTGLGLAIVRHNLDMYGGTVRVESELGKGARFLLHLPARTLTKAI